MTAASSADATTNGDRCFIRGLSTNTPWPLSPVNSQGRTGHHATRELSGIVSSFGLLGGFGNGLTGWFLCTSREEEEIVRDCFIWAETPIEVATIRRVRAFVAFVLPVVVLARMFGVL